MRKSLSFYISSSRPTINRPPLFVGFLTLLLTIPCLADSEKKIATSATLKTHSFGTSAPVSPSTDSPTAMEIKNGSTQIFEFSGELGDLPKGTEIHVCIQLKGNKRFLARYVTVVDEKSHIHGETKPIPKQLLPGTYELTFWVNVPTQPEPIKNWLQQNRGWPEIHSEQLPTVEVSLGNTFDRDSARLESLNKLSNFFDSHIQRLAQIEKYAKILKSKPLQSETTSEDLHPIVVDLYESFKAFSDWLDSYASIPFEDLQIQTLRCFTACSKFLSALKRGESDDLIQQARLDLNNATNHCQLELNKLIAELTPKRIPPSPRIETPPPPRPNFRRLVKQRIEKLINDQLVPKIKELRRKFSRALDPLLELSFESATYGTFLKPK